jgi:hypothetical protein
MSRIGFAGIVGDRCTKGMLGVDRRVERNRDSLGLNEEEEAQVADGGAGANIVLGTTLRKMLSFAGDVVRLACTFLMDSLDPVPPVVTKVPVIPVAPVAPVVPVVPVVPDEPGASKVFDAVEAFDVFDVFRGFERSTLREPCPFGFLGDFGSSLKPLSIRDLKRGLNIGLFVITFT